MRFLLTGQAAGALAAISVKNNTQVRNANVREVQQTLLDAGAYLMPLVDVAPTDPVAEAIQRVTSSGILNVKGEPQCLGKPNLVLPRLNNNCSGLFGGTSFV